MGIFDFFRKKQAPLTEEQLLDNLWTLWEQGRAPSPAAELMTYESEVNNGGHSQYFFNLAGSGSLNAAMDVILPILPAPLKENLHRGYLAFAAQEDIADDANDALFDECDSVFYQHEQLLTDLLRAYAKASFH